jgi:ABC-2 type transport system ATP-binding protein
MVRSVVHDLRQRGVTVFLNSHLLSEVEVTCTRVAIITQGRVRQVADLSHFAGGLLEVEVQVGEVDDGFLEGLRRWGQEVQVAGGGRVYRLKLPSREALPEVSRWIVERGVDLYSISSRPVSLEDLFVDVVGDDGAPSDGGEAGAGQ